MRYRIMREIIEKHEDSMYFMVIINDYLMEAMDPTTSVKMPMGYEVDPLLLEAYVEEILKNPMDTNEERFETYEGKNINMNLELHRPAKGRKIEQKFEKLVKSLVCLFKN